MPYSELSSCLIDATVHEMSRETHEQNMTNSTGTKQLPANCTASIFLHFHVLKWGYLFDEFCLAFPFSQGENVGIAGEVEQ